MVNVKLVPIMSALLLSIGCTAEGPQSSLPAPQPGPAPVASTPVAATSATDTPVAGAPVAPTVVVCTPLPTPVTFTSLPDSNSPLVDPRVFIDSLERIALRTAEGKASRLGLELRIRLLNGGTAFFKDDTAKFRLRRYAGYLKAIHFHVVHGIPMEGNGYHQLVDDSTGDSTVIYGMPVPSPDGNRFVLTSMGGVTQYDPSMIEVWRMVARKPEIEFSFDTGSQPWEADDAVWRDSVTIDFIKYSSNDPSKPYVKTPGCLGRTGTTWVVAP